MYGTTLPTISMEATPGYPAPETACIVETITDLMPNRTKGARAMVKTMVEQFGLVTIAPCQPRFFRWTGMTERCPGLISGTSSGTSASIRWLREFETTMCPAWANSCSISVATEASIAENTSFGAEFGRQSDTTV